MPKGYSKEIMEALFKEEQEKQNKHALQVEANKQKQYEEYLQILSEAEKKTAEERIAVLEKQIKTIKALAIAALLLAILAVAAVYGESIQQLITVLP